MTLIPKIEGREELSRSRFLNLTRIAFTDEQGRKRFWDSTERLNSSGAVIILPRLEPSGEWLLIRQFRPPAGTYVIEFPAGLIDESESPDQTAERELWEETGFQGEIGHVSVPVYNSPGLSGETVIFVEMTINSDNYPDNTLPVPHLEDSENISCHRIKYDQLANFLKQRTAEGDAIDAKVMAFALQQTFNS